MIYILQKNSRYIFIYWIEPYRMEFITPSSQYITGSIVSHFIPQNSIPDFSRHLVQRFQDESIEGTPIYRQINIFSQVNAFA